MSEPTLFAFTFFQEPSIVKWLRSDTKRRSGLRMAVITFVAVAPAAVVARLAVDRSLHDASDVREHSCLLHTLYVRLVCEPVEAEAASIGGLHGAKQRADPDKGGESEESDARGLHGRYFLVES